MSSSDVTGRPPGRPSLQVGVHHLLPRRAAEDPRQEDLRGLPRHALPVSGDPARAARDENGRHDAYRGPEHGEWHSPPPTLSLICEGRSIFPPVKFFMNFVVNFMVFVQIANL